MDFAWGTQLPYHDFASQIKRLWGGRVQKISVDAGFSCPNRDGTIGSQGCAWCSVASFVPSYCGHGLSITQQVQAGIDFFAHKYQGQRYLVFFQAYSGTYGNIDLLRRQYAEALTVPGVVGLVISTRPDTFNQPIIDMLADLAKQTDLTVELGIESSLDRTLSAMGRGHGYAASVQAAQALHQAGIRVGAHLILGLPGETRQDFREHALAINQLPLSTLKIHHLQIIEGTPLAERYRRDPESFHLFTVDEYLTVLEDFICHLQPRIAIERFCNEAPEGILVAPRWGGLKNFALTHRLVAQLKAHGSYQGQAVTAALAGEAVQ